MQKLELSDLQLNNLIAHKSFLNTDVYRKENIFNKSISKILSNYLPHETILCVYRYTLWFRSNYRKTSFKGFCIKRQLNFLQDRLLILLSLQNRNITVE